MNWITIAGPMVSAASLTLRLVELRIALGRSLQSTSRPLFSLSAFMMAAFCRGLAAPALGEISAEELAKLTQSAVGNLISVPF